jgi:NAD/NADP transhydrogenase alpha subunit
MVEAMPAGGVTVDLAAASGGNVETTVAGRAVRHGAVTCVGFTDLESRMGSTASSLFGGNVSNLLLAMQDKASKTWLLDLNDPAVRSVCVATDGQALPPYVPPVQAGPEKTKKPTAAEEKLAKAPTLLNGLLSL